jgi:hypothetical protein
MNANVQVYLTHSAGNEAYTSPWSLPGSSQAAEGVRQGVVKTKSGRYGRKQNYFYHSEDKTSTYTNPPSRVLVRLFVVMKDPFLSSFNLLLIAMLFTQKILLFFVSLLVRPAMVSLFSSKKTS